jgi:hypothetical protein
MANDVNLKTRDVARIIERGKYISRTNNEIFNANDNDDDNGYDYVRYAMETLYIPQRKCYS